MWSSEELKGVRQGSILSHVMFNMVMDEVIRRVTDGQECRLPNIMV
jgi:hypothetical protein